MLVAPFFPFEQLPTISIPQTIGLQILKTNLNASCRGIQLSSNSGQVMIHLRGYKMGYSHAISCEWQIAQL